MAYVPGRKASNFFSQSDNLKKTTAQDALAKGQALRGAAQAGTDASKQEAGRVNEATSVVKNTNVGFDNTNTNKAKAMISGGDTPVLITPPAPTIQSTQKRKDDLGTLVSGQEQADQARQEELDKQINQFGADVTDKNYGQMAAKSKSDQDNEAFLRLLAESNPRNSGLLANLYGGGMKDVALDSNVLNAQLNQLRQGAGKQVDERQRSDINRAETVDQYGRVLEDKKTETSDNITKQQDALKQLKDDQGAYNKSLDVKLDTTRKAVAKDANRIKEKADKQLGSLKEFLGKNKPHVATADAHDPAKILSKSTPEQIAKEMRKNPNYAADLVWGKMGGGLNAKQWLEHYKKDAETNPNPWDKEKSQNTLKYYYSLMDKLNSIAANSRSAEDTAKSQKLRVSGGKYTT